MCPMSLWQAPVIAAGLTEVTSVAHAVRFADSGHGCWTRAHRRSWMHAGEVLAPHLINIHSRMSRYSSFQVVHPHLQGRSIEYSNRCCSYEVLCLAILTWIVIFSRFITRVLCQQSAMPMSVVLSRARSPAESRTHASTISQASEVTGLPCRTRKDLLLL